MSDRQYLSVAAPLLTPATQDAPQTCDRWKPTYPDRIHKAVSACLLATTMVVPVFVPVPADAPQTMDRWAPSYPERVPRVTYRPATQPFYTTNLLPIPPQGTADVGGPIMPAGSYALWQYLPLVGPLDNPAVAPAETSEWRPIYPSLISRRAQTLAAQQPFWTMDQFDPPTATSIPSVGGLQAVYPSKIAVRQPTGNLVPSFTIDAVYLAPPQPADTSQFRGSYPDYIFRTHRLATYVWGQQMFAYEVDVPVESWTGWYLDPPVLPRRSLARVQPPIGTFYIPDETVPAPALSWQGRFPDRLLPRPPVNPGPSTFAPVFVADVTVSSGDNGGLAFYPAQIAPRRALTVANQRAWTMDATWTAPVPPSVPALSASVYPVRVYGRTVPAIHPDWTAPNYVLDVTLPAPQLSWHPRYPDQVFRSRYRQPYWEVEITWFFQFPLSLFRAEWAMSSNAYITGTPLGIIEMPFEGLNRAFGDAFGRGFQG